MKSCWALTGLVSSATVLAIKKKILSHLLIFVKHKIWIVNWIKFMSDYILYLFIVFEEYSRYLESREVFMI